MILKLTAKDRLNRVVTIIFDVIIIIILGLAIIGSIAAWINTKIILEELALIKKELGIKEDNKSSFLDSVDEED